MYDPRWLAESVISIEDLGHTEEDHIGVSDNDLKARVASRDPHVWVPRSTSFNDNIDVVENVRRAIMAHREDDEFVSFLTFSAPGITRTISLDFKCPIGRGFFVNTHWKDGPRECSRIVVCVKIGRDGEPEIKTAYPALSAQEEKKLKEDRKAYFEAKNSRRR